MQIRLSCGLKNVVKRLPWCGKHGYRHPKHLCEWLAWKVKAFLNVLIYVNIFKKCVETSKPVSKWLLNFWTKTRFCVEMALCRNCLCRSDWHPVSRVMGVDNQLQYSHSLTNLTARMFKGRYVTCGWDQKLSQADFPLSSSKIIFHHMSNTVYTSLLTVFDAQDSRGVISFWISRHSHKCQCLLASSYPSWSGASLASSGTDKW